MKLTHSLFLTTGLVCMTGTAMAGPICAPSNAVGLPGIGDGCSVPSVAGILFPDIAAFKGTFTPACNQHDKCYSTLGTSYGECDGNFYSNMRSACRSRFHPIFQPVEYFVCNDVAGRYYAAVVAYGSQYNPLPGIQAEALQRSRQMQVRVDSDVCGTTPGETTLYSSGLQSEINSAFLTYAGRAPTVYEFFAAVNAGDIVNNRSAWSSQLVSRAIQAASVTPPAVSYVRSGGWGDPVTLTASPNVPSVNYRWNLDVINTTGPSVAIPMVYPEYNFHWSFEGYLKATAPNGTRNMVLVREHVYELGWCGSSPGQACY
jgi:hypothetical protein